MIPKLYIFLWNLTVYTFKLAVAYVICISLMFGLEGEILGGWAQNHLRDFDPIIDIWRSHKGLQIISSRETRRTLINLMRKSLEEANWDIAMEEWQPAHVGSLANSTLKSKATKTYQFNKKNLTRSIPCASEPQCSMPMRAYSFKISKRSWELMSQRRRSLISVNNQGLMIAPRASIKEAVPLVSHLNKTGRKRVRQVVR